MPYNPAFDAAKIDAAWERHKAAAPVCNCGAATEGRWADKHDPKCDVFSRDREAPDWPPRASAIGLPEGERQYGSTGQLWEVKTGAWARVRSPLI